MRTVHHHILQCFFRHPGEWRRINNLPNLKLHVQSLFQFCSAVVICVRVFQNSDFSSILVRGPVWIDIYFIYYKIRTTGYKNKTQCKKNIYKNTQKVHYEVHKNHIIKSTSDSQNSEI